MVVAVGTRPGLSSSRARRIDRSAAYGEPAPGRSTTRITGSRRAVRSGEIDTEHPLPLRSSPGRFGLPYEACRSPITASGEDKHRTTPHDLPGPPPVSIAGHAPT